LEPWGISALHPQSFLIEIFRQEQALVLEKLKQQAADRSRTLPQLLDILKATVPEFVAIISAAISRNKADSAQARGFLLSGRLAFAGALFSEPLTVRRSATERRPGRIISRTMAKP
jgi:hypothetical protein